MTSHGMVVAAVLKWVDCSICPELSSLPRLLCRQWLFMIECPASQQT